MTYERERHAADMEPSYRYEWMIQAQDEAIAFGEMCERVGAALAETHGSDTHAGCDEIAEAIAEAQWDYWEALTNDEAREAAQVDGLHTLARKHVLAGFVERRNAIAQEAKAANQEQQP